ncbi:hypothetical protein FHS79_001751 [Polymorphobacter multimanifer]|uniref:Polysaccharide chain length determinant N-terminal domain-containing protein n=1 Tax=Polymorphobacter multimanifer TaxID=1070431 RepID=A0A841LEJ7_9SPHN|nr:hypothetical protein [Polymorphobacter multimanifer]
MVAAVLALVAAVLWLRGAEYRHHVELRVAASPGSSGRSTNLGGLASLAAIAGVGTTVEATPFRLYLEDLTSPAAAADLARDAQAMRALLGPAWNGKDWQPPASLGERLATDLLGLHDDAAAPQGPLQLQAWLASRISVAQSERSPIVVVALDHPDPEAAKALLWRLHRLADARARIRTLERARRNIDHLDQRIGSVQELDHRQAMVATRATEQQRLMMTQNPAPYAAQPLGQPVASPGPTSPRPGLVLALALVLGVAAGVAAALLAGPVHKRTAP